MSGIARLVLVAALFLGTVTMGGCARPFPERLGWYGGDPMLYAGALRAAATEALVTQRTGANYYEHFGDSAFTMAVSDTCDPTLLDAYIVQRTRACWVLQRVGGADCADANACAKLVVDKNLLRQPGVRDVIENALRDPCASLTNPASASYPDHASKLGLSASESWRILNCADRRVIAASFSFDAVTSTYTVRLQRES